jgi:hypothetical protein
MKRQLLILFAVAGMWVSMPMSSADAAHGHGRSVGKAHGGKSHGASFGKARGRSVGHGKGFGRGVSHGFGSGFGVGGFFVDDSGIADLYRELYDNLPYFALHPPVYYSYPVPRTYGYSPFAYPPNVMTPDVVVQTAPVTVMNPYVPSSGEKTTEGNEDRAAAIKAQPEPLVIVNPFVTPGRSVAQAR